MQRNSMQLKMQDMQRRLDETEKADKDGKDVLHNMLEELANNLEEVTRDRSAWKLRCEQAGKLGVCHLLHAISMSTLFIHFICRAGSTFSPSAGRCREFCTNTSASAFFRCAATTIMGCPAVAERAAKGIR